MFSRTLKALVTGTALALTAVAHAPQTLAQIETTTEQDPTLPAVISANSWHLAFGNGLEAERAVDFFRKRGDKDILATLVLAMRYNSAAQLFAAQLFEDMTGQAVKTWFDAQLWLEAHPDVIPHDSYRAVKLLTLSTIDPNFMQFLGGERSNPEKMTIRLEEISWGGVSVDGIPSLDDPKLIDATQARYLNPNDQVFGVEINGDARAYPLRIMGWHEMFNETIGGVDVALAYCTLCGSGILYETKIDRYEEALHFGSSGFLYRSNKLMFDRHTFSLWNQFTGKPVTGPLVGSGIELKVRPVAITTWAKWKKQHPDTKVLSLDTGHARNYGSGVVYRDYFNSPDLMFPAIVKDESIVKRKDYVFGMRDDNNNKAWPLALFKGGAVLNDTFGAHNVVLIGEAKTRTVRAYYSDGREFDKGEDDATLKGPNGTWRITEEGLVGPKGEKLGRAPGAISFWFAFENYFGDDAELAGVLD